MRHTEFDDPVFLTRLRQGDPAAYRTLIQRLHASLTAVAATVIGSRAHAEEVVQDAWLAVFSGIGRFEGRSSLVTWVFSIVLNRARTRVAKEARLIGLDLMDGTPPDGRAVPATAFKSDGHWKEPPQLWNELNPERIVGGRQLWDHVLAAIESLPTGQRAVIVLRDMEGQGAEETCALLGLTQENQRVLLHRARGRVRQIIDDLVAGSVMTKVVPSGGVGNRPGRAGRIVQRCLTTLGCLTTLASAVAAGRRWSRPPPPSTASLSH